MHSRYITKLFLLIWPVCLYQRRLMSVPWLPRATKAQQPSVFQNWRQRVFRSPLSITCAIRLFVFAVFLYNYYFLQDYTLSLMPSARHVETTPSIYGKSKIFFFMTKCLVFSVCFTTLRWRKRIPDRWNMYFDVVQAMVTFQNVIKRLIHSRQIFISLLKCKLLHWRSSSQSDRKTNSVTKVRKLNSMP